MTNLLKKTAIVAAFAGVFFAGTASADVDTPVLGAAGSFTSPDSFAFTGHIDSGGQTLADNISFSVTNDTTGTDAAIVSQSGGNGFSTFTTSLWTTADNTGTDLADGVTSSVGPASLGIWSSIFSYSPLTSDSSPYFIHVNGMTLADSVHASYSGNMQLSPIPEPETYAMMLAGLGLMGFVARRRKQNDVA